MTLIRRVTHPADAFTKLLRVIVDALCAVPEMYFSIPVAIFQAKTWAETTGKPCLLVLNKCDLVKPKHTLLDIAEDLLKYANCHPHPSRVCILIQKQITTILSMYTHRPFHSYQDALTHTCTHSKDPRFHPSILYQCQRYQWNTPFYLFRCIFNLCSLPFFNSLLHITRTFDGHDHLRTPLNSGPVWNACVYLENKFVQDVQDYLFGLAMVGEWEYAREETTDMSDKDRVTEIIREKVRVSQ